MNPEDVNTLQEMEKVRKDYLKELMMMSANNDKALKAQQLEKITGMIEARPFFTTTTEMFEDITSLKTVIFETLKEVMTFDQATAFLYNRKYDDNGIRYLGKRIHPQNDEH